MRIRDIHLIGERSEQPAANEVDVGVEFIVTDEGNLRERSNGTTWEPAAPEPVDVSGILDDVEDLIAAIFPIDLENDVEGDLPYANLEPASAESKLLGRGEGGGAGDWQEITLGSGLTMTGTTLSAAGGSGGSVNPAENGLRPTLAPDDTDYSPAPATPLSTDTSAETVTFSVAPGWHSGTICTPKSTGGGLTAGTRYYLHKVSDTVFSFHTTVATALSGTSPVNLTASITSIIFVSGISNTSIYILPDKSKRISLYNGSSAWETLETTGITVAIGTVTADLPIDIFLYNNSGTVTAELVAWTSATARATAVVRQDGVWVKSGATTRRLFCTFVPDTTTTTIDDAGGIASQVGGKRYLAETDGFRSKSMFVFDGTATWNYNSATVRQANGATGNRVSYVQSTDGVTVDAKLDSCISVTSGIGCISIGFDQTTDAHQLPGGTVALNAINGTTNISVHHTRRTKAGLHHVNWLEFGGGSGTVTWNGVDASAQRRSGLVAVITR